MEIRSDASKTPTTNNTESHTIKNVKPIIQKEKTYLSPGLHDFCLIGSLFLYIAFFVLYYKIDPKAWTGNLLFYLIVIVACLIIYAITVSRATTNKKCIVMLMIPLVLVISASTLRMIYNSKKDIAAAAMPQNDYAYIQVSYKDQYFNSTGEGSVKDPHIYFSFGDERVSNNICKVPIGKRIVVKADVSYIWVYNGTVKGSGSETISLSEQDIMRGKQFYMSFPTEHDQSCALAISLSRYVPFWDVILA